VPDTIAIDAQRVRQVVFNLLSNAFKHTHAGHVRLTACVDDSALSVTVEDTGPGIHPYHQAQLFERFNASGPSGKNQQPGTGLGLYIVKSIVSEMKGEITVKSALGEGSCFTITLPFARIEETAADVEHKQAPDAPEENAQLLTHTSAHVLLVEDHPVNQRLFGAFLDKAGYAYTIQKDGQCAMEWLLQCSAQDRPAVVLVDVNMPRLNGIELCEFIRTQLPGGEDMALYLVTADVLEDYESCIKRLKIDGFLPKPIDFNQLRSVLSKHIGRPVIQPAA